MHSRRGAGIQLASKLECLIAFKTDKRTGIARMLEDNKTSMMQERPFATSVPSEASGHDSAFQAVIAHEI